SVVLLGPEDLPQVHRGGGPGDGEEGHELTGLGRGRVRQGDLRAVALDPVAAEDVDPHGGIDLGGRRRERLAFVGRPRLQRPGHSALSSAKLSQDLSATTLALACASWARNSGRPSEGMASNAGRSIPSGGEASSVTPPARKTRSSPAPARMAAASSIAETRSG